MQLNSSGGWCIHVVEITFKNFTYTLSPTADGYWRLSRQVVREQNERLKKCYSAASTHMQLSAKGESISDSFQKASFQKTTSRPKLHFAQWKIRTRPSASSVPSSIIEMPTVAKKSQTALSLSLLAV